jgi:hypothetical protein
MVLLGNDAPYPYVPVVLYAVDERAVNQIQAALQILQELIKI